MQNQKAVISAPNLKSLIFALQDLNGLDRMTNLETLMLDNNELTLRCEV